MVWAQEPKQSPSGRLAAPGEQPPELALGSLGGVLAAWSRQGLNCAGPWVN